MLVKANDELYLDTDNIEYIYKNEFGNWRLVFDDGSNIAIRDENVEETFMNLTNQSKDAQAKNETTLKDWRDTSKKYYVKLKGLDKEGGYLNYDMQEDRYFTDDNDSGFSWAKVSFSVNEIDGMINNPDFFLTENNFDPIPVD